MCQLPKHLTFSLGSNNGAIMFFEKQRIENVLNALEDYSSSQDDRVFKVLGNQIIEHLEMHRGQTFVTDIVTHPYIVKEYAMYLIGRYGEEYFESRKEQHEKMKELSSLDCSVGMQVRIRRFLPTSGPYFGHSFRTDDGIYTFWNNEPVLITKLRKKWQDELMGNTAMSVMTRLEVKTIASIMFSNYTAHGPTCNFIFSEEYHDLPASLVFGNIDTIPDTIAERANIAINVIERMSLRDRFGFKSKLLEIYPYQFRTFNFDIARTRKFFDSFNLNDGLALRTAFLLIKSASLWDTSGIIFGEEATANMFFALEGCLRLIHRRAFPGEKFQIKPTVQHVEEKFPHEPEYSSWMIEDAYDRRIQIVHPESRTHIGWLPDLSADDFYENYGMVNNMLYYAITGDILPQMEY